LFGAGFGQTFRNFGCALTGREKKVTGLNFFGNVPAKDGEFKDGTGTDEFSFA